MKKILLFMIGFFLTSCAIFSFAYADSKSDIETIYSDKISSIETQMNRAFSDLEKIYITSISNAQARLKDANDNIKRIQDNYSFQIDLAINAFKSSGVVLSESELQSMAVDSIRGIKTQADAQIDAQEKIVTQITTQIKSLQNEKASKLVQIKSQYQVKIDALIAERTSLIESLVIQPSNPVQTTQPSNPVQTTQPSNPVQTISTNNSTQITNNNNNSNQTVSESGKIKCPENSYDIYNGNGAYISCKCKQGFEYGSFGACTSKYKGIEESCKLKHGANSSSSNGVNSSTDCICNSGYILSESNLCITDKEKLTENNSSQRRNSGSNSLTVSTSIGSIHPVWEYNIQKTPSEFNKSKLLTIDTQYIKGEIVSIYQVLPTGTGGTKEVKVGTTKILKGGKLRFPVKRSGNYKIIKK